MDFDEKLHQKVIYIGQSEFLKTIRLFVILKDEFPDFYTLNSDEEVVIHQVNKFNQIIHNLDLKIRNSFKVKRSEIELEGDLYVPEP